MISNPWIQWMQSWQAPFSNYDQNISPVTTWFSPTYELNYAGNPAIEAKITKDVASFGKQLGVISEAVLELSEGQSGEALDKLRTMSEQIEKIKRTHESEEPNQLAVMLKELKKADRKAFDQLMLEVNE